MARTQAALPDFGPAIERLRRLVAESGDHLLLGDGPPHPDAKLLDLCADALHHLRRAEKANARRHLTLHDYEEYTQEIRAQDEQLWHVYCDGTTRARLPLRLIAKAKASTAAGIYAKAAVVRASRTGAVVLAMSLAEDLLANEALRSLLWPASAERD